MEDNFLPGNLDQNPKANLFPEPRKRRTLLVVSLVVVGLAVIISGGMLYYYQQVNKIESSATPSAGVSKQEIINLLAQKSRLSLPKLSYSQVLPSGSLSDYNKYVLFPEATSLSVEKAFFEGKIQGLIISYKRRGNLEDTYRTFVNSAPVLFNGLKIIYGGRTNDVALLDLSGQSGKTRIILISDGSVVSINITAVNF